MDFRREVNSAKIYLHYENGPVQKAGPYGI
jgi:hypothetical protein